MRELGPFGIAAVLAVTVLGLAHGAFATAAGSAAPGSGLTDGQAVRVRASGLPSRTVMVVVQCVRGATSSLRCEGSTADLSVSTDADGNYDNPRYQVFKIPNSIIKANSITCDGSNKCDLFIGVDYNDFRQPHTFVPIEFEGALSTAGSRLAYVGLSAGVLTLLGVGFLLQRRRNSLRAAG